MSVAFPEETKEAIFDEVKEEEASTPKKETPTKKTKKSLTSSPSSSSIVVELSKLRKDLQSTGIPIKKHCSDGKIRKRTLIMSGDAKRLGWKTNQNYDAMIPLRSVLEVRAATTVDPTTVSAEYPGGVGGTETFRKTCDGINVARRGFSLILKNRTLDIEVETELDARKLCKSFKALVQKAKN